MSASLIYFDDRFGWLTERDADERYPSMKIVLEIVWNCLFFLNIERFDLNVTKMTKYQNFKIQKYKKKI